MSTFVCSTYNQKKTDNEYFHCLFKMMYTLSKRCAKAITSDPVDHQKFAACVGKLFGLLIKMEEERPQLLRFSESLNELTGVLGLQGINLNMNEDINESSKPKSQIQQQVRRLEATTKSVSKNVPLRLVSKSVDQSFSKLYGKKKVENDDTKEVVKEIEFKNSGIPQKAFFHMNRRSTETNQTKTLEQKEKEFLQLFQKRVSEG